MTRREFSIFIIFSDTYTCSYVVFQFWADSDQNMIFYEFLKLLKSLIVHVHSILEDMRLC